MKTKKEEVLKYIKENNLSTGEVKDCNSYKNVFYFEDDKGLHLYDFQGNNLIEDILKQS